jgi:hypothetical protein
MSEIDLSVVLITASDYRRLRKTVRHLANQDVADRIQLILVCQDPSTIQVPVEDVQGIGEVTVFDAGTFGRPANPERRPLPSPQVPSRCSRKITAFRNPDGPAPSSTPMRQDTQL